MRPPVPKWLLQNIGMTTQREFRARKRKEVRVAIKAVDVLLRGYAGCPPDCLIRVIEQMLEEWALEKFPYWYLYHLAGAAAGCADPISADGMTFRYEDVLALFKATPEQRVRAILTAGEKGKAK